MSTRTVFATFGSLAVVLLAYFVVKLPSTVVPPHVPADSPIRALPPWFILRPAVALNDLFVFLARVTTPPDVHVLNLGGAYLRSDALYALTKNGIMDALGETPSTCQAVAARLDLQEHAVCTFLLAGHDLGLLAKDAKTGIYTLTASGSLLQTNAEGSLSDYILTTNTITRESSFAATHKSIKSGASGVKEAVGLEFWEYLQANSDVATRFDRVMREMGTGQVGGILSTWSPPRDDIVFCDIAGGLGTLTAHFLEHYPKATGIVFDQPSVVETSTRPFLSKRGLSERASTVGGSFFQPFPEQMASCDVFFLKWILHDWPDQESVAILQNVKAVAKPGSKIVLGESALEVGVSQGFESANVFLNLIMQCLCPFGSKERTLPELANLFKAANITATPSLLPTRTPMSIIEVDAF